MGGSSCDHPPPREGSSYVVSVYINKLAYCATTCSVITEVEDSDEVHNQFVNIRKSVKLLLKSQNILLLTFHTEKQQIDSLSSLLAVFINRQIDSSINSSTFFLMNSLKLSRFLRSGTPSQTLFLPKDISNSVKLSLLPRRP